MKTTKKFSRYIASAAIMLLMLTLGSQPPRINAQHASNNIELAQKSEPKTQSSPQPDSAASTKFDGHALYKAAFEALRDKHILLRDTAARAKWVTEWENKHARDGKLDSEKTADEAVLEMMRSLNQRFDYYFLPAVTAEEEHSQAPSYSGTGLALTTFGNKTITREHPLTIALVIDGSPASRQDLKRKDRVVAVDGKPVDGMTAEDAVSLIRGDKLGVPVVLSIERGDSSKPQKFNVTIVRTDYVRKDVHTRDLGDGIAYIKLDDFMSQFAVKELFAALQDAAKGKGVVLDLRGNHGGRLDYVEAMAQFFLDAGVILEQHERDSDDMLVERLSVQPELALHTAVSSSKPDSIQIKPGERMPNLLPKGMPVVVLIDGDSYSAAEILSGALQANHRATVIGEPSGGKGVGQAVVKLPFGRSMHVTCFEFLPGGEAMDWVGVIPNVEVKQPANFDEDDSSTDAQLKSAVTQIKTLLDAQSQLEQKRNELRKKNEADFQKSRKQD